MLKDEQFEYTCRNFQMTHSSPNGIVGLEAVAELYDMILDHARLYSGKMPDPKVAAANPVDKNKTRRGKRERSGQAEKDQTGNRGRKDQRQAQPGDKGQTTPQERPPTRANQADRSKGKGKSRTIKKYTYKTFNGKTMKQRYRPQAKELNGWETDSGDEDDDPDDPDDDPEDNPEGDDQQQEPAEPQTDENTPTVKRLEMMFRDLVALDKEVDREIEQQPSVKVIEASTDDISVRKV